MRKFINLNDDESDVWEEDDLIELRRNERKQGVYVYDDYDEWLMNKLETDFKEIT